MEPQLHHRSVKSFRDRPPIVIFTDDLESNPLRVVTDRRLVHLQISSVVPDAEHVLKRGERHSSASGHARRAAIIRRERVVLPVEPGDHLSEVFHAGFDVSFDTKRAEGSGHYLKITPSAWLGRKVRVASRFVETHRPRQVGVEVVASGMPEDFVFDLHDLAVHPEKARREVLQWQELAVRRGSLARELRGRGEVARQRVARRAQERQDRRRDEGGSRLHPMYHRYHL